MKWFLLYKKGKYYQIKSSKYSTWVIHKYKFAT